MNLSKFSERLSELMFDEHYNGQTLSEKLGYGYNTIYRYLECKRTPTVEKIIALADFFNCSVDFLLGLDDNNLIHSFNKCAPFKDRFAVLLKKEGVKQSELEKKTKISHSTMGYWKNGKKQPTIDNIIKIANALNCSVDYVLGRTDD